LEAQYFFHVLNQKLQRGDAFVEIFDQGVDFLHLLLDL
jgi:hypothetical protein